MSEKTIERRLVDGVKKLGGMCLKFVSPGTAGVPDRILITAGGNVIFAEIKTKEGRLSRIQEHTISEMRKRGANVRVLYGIEDVEALLDEVAGAPRPPCRYVNA